METLTEQKAKIRIFVIQMKRAILSTNVENRKNYTLVIQSENVKEREKIKEAIQSEISKEYEVRIPRDINMHISFTNLSFKVSKEELVEKLKKQNEILRNNNLDVEKNFETKEIIDQFIMHM